MSLKGLRTDKNLEVKGTICDLGEDRILCARAGGSNIAFTKRHLQFIKENRFQLDPDMPNLALLNSINIKLYAECVVMGWETLYEGEWVQGIAAEDIGMPTGPPVPCNYDNIIKVFTEIPDSFVYVQRHANTESYYRALRIQAEAKNSVASSSTV